MGDTIFFGKIDINKDGRIASPMPAWAMRVKIEDLQEEIESKERALERGDIPQDSLVITREETKKLKKRLNDILESRPKFSDVTENKLHKTHKELGAIIKPTLFTKSEMAKGTASPHEEARRMKDPVIPVTPEIAELCIDNGIQPAKQKGGYYVSRDNAVHMWKLIGNYFGAETNMESLRKD